MVLGRERCQDHAELPHVRVALQFHICFYVYVYAPPSSPLRSSIESTYMYILVYGIYID